MKSIMKKVLVMVITLAVLALPMAVSAAVYNDAANPISLSFGTKTYNVSTEYDYTVFSYEPSAEAEYTFTASGKLVGIASYNGMWITFEPGDETVKDTSVVWECTSVGQSLWITVKTDKAASVSITVTKQELEKEEEVPVTIYKNVHTPTAFTFTGDVSKLEYVDTEDGVDDRPSLGEDGYYHFGSETGPILYADLNDSLMNLIDAQSYGQLKYIGYDGDKIVTQIDFYEAFEEYSVAADANTKLYPLTEDLIQIYKLVGEFRGWYGDDGWVGGTDEDYWMFACYYEPAAIDDNQNGNQNPDGDDNNDNNNNENNNDNNSNNDNVGGNTNTNNNNNTNTNNNTITGNSSSIPKAGENMSVVYAVVVMISAMVFCVVLRKKYN